MPSGANAVAVLEIHAGLGRRDRSLAILGELLEADPDDDETRRLHERIEAEAPVR